MGQFRESNPAIHPTTAWPLPTVDQLHATRAAEGGFKYADIRTLIPTLLSKLARRSVPASRTGGGIRAGRTHFLRAEEQKRPNDNDETREYPDPQLTGHCTKLLGSWGLGLHGGGKSRSDAVSPTGIIVDRGTSRQDPYPHPPNCRDSPPPNCLSQDKKSPDLPQPHIYGGGQLPVNRRGKCARAASAVQMPSRDFSRGRRAGQARPLPTDKPVGPYGHGCRRTRSSPSSPIAAT